MKPWKFASNAGALDQLRQIGANVDDYLNSHNAGAGARTYVAITFLISVVKN